MGSGADLTYWIAFSAGILSFFSPCVLPLIPSYLTYVTGLSFGQLQESHPGAKVRLAVMLHSLVFIVGFSTVFIGLGALAGIASSTFQTYLREGLIWVQRVGGILVFLFGVHMSGLFHFGILLGEKRVQLREKPSGFFGTYLVGLAFAAGWTPCIGPILGGILAMVAGTSSNYAKGILMLAIYSAGLGIPFLVSGLLFHGFLSFFNRFRKHIRIMEIITGMMLMAVGAMLFFNVFGKLSMYLYRWIPISG
jgi:cytochrome c-type biogenesis protein